LIEEGEKTIYKIRFLWKEFGRNLQTTSYETSAEKEEPEKIDSFQGLRRRQMLKNRGRSSTQDEFDYYCAQIPSYDPDMSPIKWWLHKRQQTECPRLSLLAIEVFSIPGMSYEPERVFSGARRTISWERSSLDPDVVERVECLKRWKESGILSYVF
jgi:hypothetical protein